MNAYRIETSKRNLWIDLDRIVYIDDPKGQCNYHGAGFTIGTVSGSISITVGFGLPNNMSEQDNNENRQESLVEIKAVHRALLRAWRGLDAFDQIMRNP